MSDSSQPTVTPVPGSQMPSCGLYEHVKRGEACDTHTQTKTCSTLTNPLKTYGLFSFQTTWMIWFVLEIDFVHFLENTELISADNVIKTWIFRCYSG